MRLGILGAIAGGMVASAVILGIAGLALGHGHGPARLVAEDASAPLRTVAIHYAPAQDAVAMPVWRQLFAVLPAEVDVEVEVSNAADYDRLIAKLTAAHTPNLERFHRVVVGAPITTWSRDRYAALVDDAGRGSILAPPRVETVFKPRAGDFQSAFAISRALYHREPHVADIAFEGGDLAATPNLIFADVNLVARNVGRGEADRATIERELHRRLGQDIIFLGEQAGDVPRHHIMMYMVPLDDHTIAVGDIRAGVALLAKEPAGSELELDDVEVEAKRFDRAAIELVAHGFHVVRVPALVLAGAGSYVTYTNAVFDRDPDGTRVIYMPTYSLPALDDAAAAFWRAQGFAVKPVDVSSIYRLNGSLGCLVNVLGRG